MWRVPSLGQRHENIGIPGAVEPQGIVKDDVAGAEIEP